MKYLAPILVLLSLLLSVDSAAAHDRDPSHDHWYHNLRQPDNPAASCCGVADAYWCDDISVKNDKVFCKITDDQVVPGRPHVPLGTIVEIPPNKLKFDAGNPTGHAIVFMTATGIVFCFVQGTGI